MSDARKGKKIVNSIGVGILAFLSSGTSMLQIASAADVNEVQNAGEMLETGMQAASANQNTIDALDNAGDAINTAQGSVTDAGDIQNATEIQGELSGSAEALGKLDVVLIPVGGTYTLDCQQASDLVDRLQVKTVIPMHYRRGSVGFDVLQTLQEFLILRPGYQEMPGCQVEITEDMPETTMVLNLG